MELLLVFAISFATAITVGYLGVFFEKGAKSVSETNLGDKIGKWLYLFPLLDFAESGLARASKWIYKGRNISDVAKINEAGNKLKYLIKNAALFMLSVILALLLIYLLIYLVLWLLSYLVLDHPFVALLLVLLIGGAYYVFRKR